MDEQNEKHSLHLFIKTSSRQKIIIWSVAFLITLLSLAAHFSSPSTIHLTDSIWEQIVDKHSSKEIFKSRPLTTNILKHLAQQTDLSLRSAFFLLQFFLFFLTGPAFYYYLRSLTFSHKNSIAGMLIFLLSLPLFLAHFEPVHTWSDFWVYIFVPLSLAFTIRRNFILAILSMTIALLARETSLLFLPIIALIIYNNSKKNLLKAALVPVVSLLIYFAIKTMLVGATTASPDFGLFFNFENWIRTSDSIFSIIVSLGFLWVIGIKQIISPSNCDMNYYKIIRFGALFTTVGFLSSSLLFGQIRETRLLMPIGIFMIPLVLVYYESRKPEILAIVSDYLNTRFLQIIFGVILLAVSIGISKLLFPDFEFRRWKDGNWICLGIHISFMITFLIFELISKRRNSGK